MELTIHAIPQAASHGDGLATKPPRLGFKVRVGNDFYGACMTGRQLFSGEPLLLVPLVEGELPESCR